MASQRSGSLETAGNAFARPAVESPKSLIGGARRSSRGSASNDEVGRSDGQGDNDAKDVFGCVGADARGDGVRLR